jgi:hypothetical protein
MPTSARSSSTPSSGQLVHEPTDEELDQYLLDLERLSEIEQTAELELKRVEHFETWQPTAYEQKFLPGLRLAGLADKQNVTLQNTGDLHIHTHFSDGDDLDRVLEAASSSRLDVIAITDHDEIEGALEARRRAHERRLRFAVIPGVEVSSRDGHIGALFVTKIIPANLSAEETVRLIHEAGGLAIAHHPFAPKFIEKMLRVKLGCGELVHSVDFDAIECTNAVPGYGRRYNIEALDELYRRQVRIGMTGSSDAHCADFIGKGRTYFGGNEGVLSCRTAIQHGFIQGAEGYWRFREKLKYRTQLAKAIFRNLLGKKGSIN